MREGDGTMVKASAVHLSAFALLTAAMLTLYSCGSKPNTAATVSSASAKIVTCPTATVAIRKNRSVCQRRLSPKHHLGEK